MDTLTWAAWECIKHTKRGHISGYLIYSCWTLRGCGQEVGVAARGGDTGIAGN
jgi:hypothetical protein